MKIAVLIARVLLGLMFTVFGLNGFLHFLPMPPMSGDPGTFAGILIAHGYMAVVSALQVAGGLLVLIGRYVPLGLVFLGPIIVNILLFHLLLNDPGTAPGAVAALLEIFLIWAYRLSFRGLFDAAPDVS